MHFIKKQSFQENLLKITVSWLKWKLSLNIFSLLKLNLIDIHQMNNGRNLVRCSAVEFDWYWITNWWYTCCCCPDCVSVNLNGKKRKFNQLALFLKCFLFISQVVCKYPAYATNLNVCINFESRNRKVSADQ